MVKIRTGPVAGEIVETPGPDQSRSVLGAQVPLYPAQAKGPDAANINPRPKNRKRVRVLQLGNRLVNLEFSKSHIHSLTAQLVIYKQARTPSRATFEKMILFNGALPQQSIRIDILVLTSRSINVAHREGLILYLKCLKNPCSRPGSLLVTTEPKPEQIFFTVDSLGDQG